MTDMSDSAASADDETVSAVDAQTQGGETTAASTDRSNETSDEQATSGDDEATGSRAGRRTVAAPHGLVKVVVIFSTLIAIVAVLLGFMLLDAATRVIENPPASVFVGLVKSVTGLSSAGVEPHLTTIAWGVGLLGLAMIGLGAWVYAMGTRFRTTDGNA